MATPKKSLIFSQKKAVLMFQEVTFRVRKMKKPTLKKLLIFQEMKTFNLKLKKLLFFVVFLEPLRFFHHCFFRCFHFTIDFYCFQVFSLLITFVHFITVSSGVFISPLILLLFFEYFHFTNFLYCDCFLSGTVSATDLRELFLLLGIFYLTPSRHLVQPAFIKAFLGPAVPP